MTRTTPPARKNALASNPGLLILVVLGIANLLPKSSLETAIAALRQGAFADNPADHRLGLHAFPRKDWPQYDCWQGCQKACAAAHMLRSFALARSRPRKPRPQSGAMIKRAASIWCKASAIRV